MAGLSNFTRRLMFLLAYGITDDFMTSRFVFFALLVASVLLSSCAFSGGAAVSCKVLDPDLAVGEYRGGCRDGLADGYGEVTGNSSYRGDFLAGRKHGKGIKSMPNGDKYAGEFASDFRHGKGTYVWGEKTPWAGERFEGTYRQDQRHGSGVYTWATGDRYEGPWENDLRMGFSVMETRRAQHAAAMAAMRASHTVTSALPEVAPAESAVTVGELVANETALPVEQPISSEPAVPVEQVVQAEPAVPVEQVVQAESAVPVEQLIPSEPAVPVVAPTEHALGMVFPVAAAVKDESVLAADQAVLPVSPVVQPPAAGVLAGGELVEVGNTICLDVPLGLNHHQRLTGVLESVAGEQATIRLVAMDGTRASMQGKMVRVGAVVSDALNRWKLCDD